jgi:hypothetical protein
MKRTTPNVISKRLTSSKSSRGGANPKLIVLHTTEGVMRLKDRAKFWDGVEASAHAGVGNRKFGEQESSARYVKDDDKAWTQAGYNPVSLAIEIEGFASQASWDRGTVREVARWIAHWSIHENIPIRFGRVFAGKVVRSGVIRHSSLGALGGGHSDPGTFPMREAMRVAKLIKQQRLA